MSDVDAIGAYLRDASAPVTLKRIQQDFRGRHKLDEKAVPALLQEAEAAGLAFAWPRYRRSPRYWSRDPGTVTREEVLEIAGENALPKKDLIAKTVRQAHNCGRKAAEEVVTALVKSGTLKSAKTVGTAALFYRTDRPQVLVEPSMAMLLQRLRLLGADTGAPEKTKQSPDTERILAAIRPGGPVTVQSLRSAVGNIAKKGFDSAVLQLADQQRIYLTTHDHGWALPEAEREQLVWDGGQKLYVAVTLRD